MADAIGGTRLPEWQRAIAWVGIATIYAQLGIVLAGQARAAYGLMNALYLVMALALVVAIAGLVAKLPRHRAMLIGFAHLACVMFVLIGAWSVLPVSLPAAPADFQRVSFVMMPLYLLTTAAAQGARLAKEP